MALVGTLSTMPLPDLLQWLASAGQTGVLHVERDKRSRSISFRDGRLVACSTDDPPQRLGQYLLSRERIDEAQLREALDTQRQSGEHLGSVLVTMGLITGDELSRHLEGQAEETFYSLFDWSDGVFRFEDGPVEPPQPSLDLKVEDVLLRGLKRFDEMQRVREAFPSMNVVLRYTAKPPSPEIFSDAASRSMYSAIDGERSLAEIVLHVHGSEYHVLSFLFELYNGGYVETGGVKAPAEPVEPPRAAPTETRTEIPQLELSTPAASTDPPAGPATTAAEATAVLDAEWTPASGDTIEQRLAHARKLMADGSVGEALNVLDGLYREHPEDDSLRRLTAAAEADFVEHAYRHLVPADSIPRLTRPVEALSTESLSPQEFFILSRIDGNWDVRSIVQIAPMREVDALRTLVRMREQGMLELEAVSA